jgi:hypothetical protein
MITIRIGRESTAARSGLTPAGDRDAVSLAERTPDSPEAGGWRNRRPRGRARRKVVDVFDPAEADARGVTSSRLHRRKPLSVVHFRARAMKVV